MSRQPTGLAAPASYTSVNTNERGIGEHTSLVGKRTLMKAPEEGKATVLSSTCNLINTVIGAGIITLPDAMREAGSVIGAVMLVVTCVLSIYSFRLLVRMSDATGLFSYRDIAVQAYGPVMSKICQLVLMLYTTGTCVGYGVLVGDFLPKVFEHWLSPSSILCKREFVIAVVAVTAMLPLSLLKNMDALKFSSFAALVCVVYTFGVLLYHFTEHGMSSSIEALRFKPSIMLAFPLLVVSFTAHYNALTFYKELKDRSTERMHTVITSACGFCLVFYAGFAYVGYFQFGAATDGDVLNNFSTSWIPVLVARLALGFVLIFSYPLVHHALRKNLDAFLFLPASAPAEDSPTWRLRLLTVCVVLATNGLAIVVPGIATVLGLNGALLGTTLVYTLPGLFYIRLHRSLALDSRATYYGAWFLVVFGILAGIAAFTINVLVLTPAKRTFGITTNH